MRLTNDRPSSRPHSIQALYWWLFAAVVGFFLLSLSEDVDRVTAPHIFGLHVILRKGYSIIAFGIVAYLLARIRRSRFNDIFPLALVLSGYSALIEIAQYAVGSHEGLYWNLIDIECGFLGGYLGTGFHVWLARRHQKIKSATASQGPGLCDCARLRDHGNRLIERVNDLDQSLEIDEPKRFAHIGACAGNKNHTRDCGRSN